MQILEEFDTDTVVPREGSPLEVSVQGTGVVLEDHPLEVCRPEVKNATEPQRRPHLPPRLVAIATPPHGGQPQQFPATEVPVPPRHPRRVTFFAPSTSPRAAPKHRPPLRGPLPPTIYGRSLLPSRGALMGVTAAELSRDRAVACSARVHTTHGPEFRLHIASIYRGVGGRLLGQLRSPLSPFTASP